MTTNEKCKHGTVGLCDYCSEILTSHLRYPLYAGQEVKARNGTEFGKNTEGYWIIIPVYGKRKPIYGEPVIFSVRNNKTKTRRVSLGVLIPWWEEACTMASEYGEPALDDPDLGFSPEVVAEAKRRGD